MKNYANAHTLVSPLWLDEYKQDINFVIVEVDVDTGIQRATYPWRLGLEL